MEQQVSGDGKVWDSSCRDKEQKSIRREEKLQGRVQSQAVAGACKFVKDQSAQCYAAELGSSVEKMNMGPALGKGK